MNIKLRTNAKLFAKELSILNYKGMAFALKYALDDTADAMAKNLAKRWRAKYADAPTARGKRVLKPPGGGVAGKGSRIANVAKGGAVTIHRAYVNAQTGGVVKPARIVSYRLNELLGRQIYGGKVPVNAPGNKVFIPTRQTKRSRTWSSRGKVKTTVREGYFTYATPNKGGRTETLWARKKTSKRGKPHRLGTLASNILVKPNFPLGPTETFGLRYLPRAYERALRKELERYYRRSLKGRVAKLTVAR